MDDDMVYFIRILLLIFKGGKMVCKGILDKELKDAGVSLDQILKGQEEKLKNKILRIQHSLLFPRNDRVNPGDFDLSLLIVVLHDVMNMPEEIRKLIKTIKEIRDEIIHGGKVALTQATYESMKTSLTESLSKLGESLSDGIRMELSQMIETFLTEPFVGQTALSYVDEMKNEEEILQWVHTKVEELVGEITTQERQMIENMKRDQDTLDKLIETMEELNEDKKTLSSPKKRATSTGINCMRCIESYLLNTAVFYCATCKIYLCADCHSVTHEKSLKISMKNHHIRNAEAAAETVDMKGMDICDTHNEIITYYCKNHKELCCDKCKNNKHDNCHQLDEIEKFAQRSYNKELNPVAAIEELQKQIGEMEQWMTAMETKMDKQLSKLPSKLQDKRTQMLEAFDKKAALLKRNAETIHKEKMGTISRNRSQFNELNRKSDQAKTSLKLIEASGTAAERFIAQHYLNSQFRTCVEFFYNLKEIYEREKELDDFESIDSLHNDLEPLSLNQANCKNT